MIIEMANIAAVAPIPMVFAMLGFFLPTRNVGIAMTTGRKIVRVRIPSKN